MTFVSFQDVIPQTHPCYRELYRTLDTYIAMQTNYYSFHSQLCDVTLKSVGKPMSMVTLDESDRLTMMKDFLANYGDTSYTLYSRMRGSIVMFQMNMATQLAGYRDVTFEQDYMRAIYVYSELKVGLDSVLDNDLKYGALNEVKYGDPGNVYVKFFLKDMKAERNPALKKLFADTFLRRFGMVDKADAKQLVMQWRERGLMEKYIKPYLAELMTKWDEAVRKGEAIGLPMDGFWRALLREIGSHHVLTDEKYSKAAEPLIQKVADLKSNGLPVGQKDGVRPLVELLL